MNHRPQCIPCFLRRVLQIASQVTADDWLQRKVLGEVMKDLAKVNDKSTPAEVMYEVFRRTAKTLGNPDPFAGEKKRWKEEVLANADTIRSRIATAADPLLQALKLSIAANEIDDELRQGFTLKGLLEGIDQRHFEPESLGEFRAAAAGAGSLLFVHDSTGELFFDRLLIEELRRLAKPECKVTSVVRSHPALGDADREDAVDVGLDQLGEVVDPGLECLGLPISECSTDFRERFKKAELIVTKGQACYQTLEGEGGNPDTQGMEIWFLFRVKCPVMAQKLATSIGDLVLERN